MKVKKNLFVLAAMILLVASCSSRPEAPNCASAARDPLVDIKDLHDTYRGPHFHTCVHIRTTVSGYSSSESGGSEVYLGGGEIGAVRAHFTEPFPFSDKDTVELVGYVDETSIKGGLFDELFNCKVVGPK